MNYTEGKLLRINRKGKLLIITDLHGNLEDAKRYQEIWDEFIESGDEVVLTGDVIHPVPGQKDHSIEVLELVKSYDETYSNFHLLLGNHEFSHLSEALVYKGGVDQTREFESNVREQFHSRKDYWGRSKLREYEEYFRSLPIAVKTDNKVFISHAGPALSVETLDDIRNITQYGYFYVQQLAGMLFKRPGRFNYKDMQIFLKIVGCNAQVVGHTPVDGYEVVYGMQMVLSSSDTAGKKAYLELDLEKEIINAHDLVNMVKFLDEV
ncbi:metallophosphoesterase [uncultured Methanobacterium sp.]|uniref:metallophosphoesterase n=1 Tax=uncultured Methanobacterium sp. TaxID=176306 RepID=UPI002AA6C063|nr:metallophosphoesterase [uncultured Methanobacterium sp.]